MYRYKKTPMTRINFLIGNSPRVKLQNQSRSIWPSMYRPKISTHVYSKLGSSLFTPQPRSTNMFAPVGKRPAASFWGDSDRDGIMNGLDCAPYNKRKQGFKEILPISKASYTGTVRHTMPIDFSSSTPSTSSRPVANMANPSFTYAHQQGYATEIRADAQGNQYGIAKLPDGTEIGTWDLYRQKPIIVPVTNTSTVKDPNSKWPGIRPGEPGRITDPGNWAKPIPVPPIISTGVVRAIAQPQQTPGTSYTDSNGITHVSPPTCSGGSSRPGRNTDPGNWAKPIPVSPIISTGVARASTASVVNTNLATRTKIGPNMANPAAVYAKQQGYGYEIRNGPGGQFGMVKLPDGTEIEEWKLFNQAQARPAPGGYKYQPIPAPIHDDTGLPSHKHLMGEPHKYGMSVWPNEDGVYF